MAKLPCQSQHILARQVHEKGRKSFAVTATKIVPRVAEVVLKHLLPYVSHAYEVEFMLARKTNNQEKLMDMT